MRLRFEDQFHLSPAWSRRCFLAAAGSLATGVTADPARPAVTGQSSTAPDLLSRGRTSTGLDFPGSARVDKTMRFRFRDPLPAYPATYIWSAYPRRQAGYYTAFFWGNDDGKDDLRTFLWTPSGDADTYYGAHPYPSPRPHGTNHHWEISVLRYDFVNGAVDYDRWHRQAMRVWADPSGKYHEFYWDLPRTDARRRVTFKAPARWGNVNPPSPALTWGDAPWAPGKEVWNGVLRGIQIYTEPLSVGDILREAMVPRSTRAGARSLWYLNADPSPDDITDKSGRGHHPQWVGPERPQLWLAREEPLFHPRPDPVWVARGD
jgi:hypothetical protein